MMLLFRAFKTKEYALSFLKTGQMYMNPLNYFKEYEESLKNNIADEYEGIYRLLQPKNATIIAYPMGAGEKLELIEPISPVAFYDSQYNSVKIYCFSILDINENVRNKKEIRIKDLFDFDKNELGNYLVLIADVPELLKRMSASLDAYDLGYGSVDYYDCSASHQALSVPIFMKSNKFAHQQEFRVVIDTDEAEDTDDAKKAFVTDIGSLEDIAYPVLHKSIFKEVVLANFVKKNDRYSMSLLYPEFTS